MSQDREPLTIDDLASIYRTETKSKALSDVRKDFYPALSELSDSSRREYEDALKKDPGSIFSEGTNERRKRILLHSRNIMDLRMEKIVRLALLGAMGGVNSVDHLTTEEREYYAAVMEASKRHRSTVENRTRAKATTLDAVPEAASATTDKESKPQTDVAAAADDVPGMTAGETDEDVGTTVREDEEMTTVRILEDLPVFSGPDRDYDLKKEDVIRMPAVMAEALIVREKAVRIDVTP